MITEIATKPKRNSGRTGKRRLTAAEIAQRDQHAVADRRRRYGRPLPVNELPMPDPPKWFTSVLRGIWHTTLTTAPAGLLRAVDATNLAVLCVAVELHQRLAQQLIEAPGPPDADLVRQVRMIGAEVGRASRVLGLNPSERARIGLPATAEQDTADEWGPLQAFPVAQAA
jgi:phage terminase small subunit